MFTGNRDIPIYIISSFRKIVSTSHFACGQGLRWDWEGGPHHNRMVLLENLPLGHRFPELAFFVSTYSFPRLHLGFLFFQFQSKQNH